MSFPQYTPEPTYRLKKGLEKAGNSSLWATLSVLLVGWAFPLLPDWLVEMQPGIQSIAEVTTASVLFFLFKFLRNLIKVKFNVEFPLILSLTFCLVLPLSGCAMDRQAYIDDTGASYNRTLTGVGFRIDKDVAGAELIWNAEGGSATIGKETTGIDALTGFEKGLEAGNQMLGSLMPFLMLQAQPTPASGGMGQGAFAQMVADIVMGILVQNNILERVEP